MVGINVWPQNMKASSSLIKRQQKLQARTGNETGCCPNVLTSCMIVEPNWCPNWGVWMLLAEKWIIILNCWCNYIALY